MVVLRGPSVLCGSAVSVHFFTARDRLPFWIIYELILQRTSVRISSMDAAIKSLIAKDVALPEVSVNAVLELFEKGNTVPFIARYRKEDTGGLDATKVSAIQERLTYYREVLDRRAALLKILEEQGKLTPELRLKIESCCSKVDIEDLHHQFRPKKKPRVTEALEKGLEPLAEYLWNQEPDAWNLETHTDVFIDPAKKVESREQALQGAINIIAEWISENIEYRAALREMLLKEGFVVSTVVPAKAAQKTKYNMYTIAGKPFPPSPRTGCWQFAGAPRKASLPHRLKEMFPRRWASSAIPSSVTRSPFSLRFSKLQSAKAITTSCALS